MNQVILMGNLTKDPELKYTPTTNTAICKFSIAVNRDYQKPGEERQVDFINCQAWTKTAEFISKFFQKGKPIAIIGKMQNRNWDDNEGKKHSVTEVIVDRCYFAGGDKNSNPNTNKNTNTNKYASDDEQLPF